MNLLRNKRDFREWATGPEGWCWNTGCLEVAAPTQYPCYAYTEVVDYDGGFTEPRYLYEADLDIMLGDVRKEAP